MAREIRGASPSGTLYSRLMNSAGFWGNGSSFEAYAAANYSLYAITMTEQGNSGVYTADMPSWITTAGIFEYFVHRQAGASPAEGDPVINTGKIYWTGSASVSMTPAVSAISGAAMITRLRQAKKDTSDSRQQRTDAVYTSILTDAQNFFNYALELCRKEFTINLVAGTRVYQVDSAFIKFPAERLRKRSGLVYYSGGQLEPTDAPLLDAEETGWRDNEDGTPTRFYIQPATTGDVNLSQICLDRAPDDAFVADHPTLTYYGVYEPAVIPLDSNPQFKIVHELMVFYALTVLEAEDGNLEKADERWASLQKRTEAVSDQLARPFSTGGGFRFDPSWRKR